GVNDAITALFSGKPVNHTEKRMALHTALRLHDDELPTDIAADIIAVRRKMLAVADQVGSGQWLGHSGKPVETIVNIGVGGSDLGLMMAVHALQDFRRSGLTFHFVSNIDPAHISLVLEQCDPDTTLFIVASKTFTTLETLSNANAARDWVI